MARLEIKGTEDLSNLNDHKKELRCPFCKNIVRVEDPEFRWQCPHCNHINNAGLYIEVE